MVLSLRLWVQICKLVCWLVFSTHCFFFAAFSGSPRLFAWRYSWVGWWNYVTLHRARASRKMTFPTLCSRFLSDLFLDVWESQETTHETFVAKHKTSCHQSPGNCELWIWMLRLAHHVPANLWRWNGVNQVNSSHHFDVMGQWLVRCLFHVTQTWVRTDLWHVYQESRWENMSMQMLKLIQGVISISTSTWPSWVTSHLFCPYIVCTIL